MKYIPILSELLEYSITDDRINVYFSLDMMRLTDRQQEILDLTPQTGYRQSR